MAQHDSNGVQSRALPLSARAVLVAISSMVAYFPLPVLVGRYFVQSSDIWLWVLFLFALCAFGTWFGRKLAFQNIVLKSILTAIIGFILSALFCEVFGKQPIVASIVLCGLVAIAACVIGVNGVRMEHSGGMLAVWALGLPFHFVAFFLFAYVETLRGDMWWISLSTLTTLALVLYQLNQVHLNTMLSARQTHVPYTVRMFNRSMVTVFLICILIAFGCFVFFVNLSSIEHAILALIQRLLQAGHHGAEPSQIQPPKFKLPNQKQAQQGLGGTGVWMHVVAILIGIFLLAACVVLVWRGVKAFWAWYQKQRVDDTEERLGYIDEEESIVGEVKRMNMRKFFRDRRREPSWNELKSAEERIRYLYRQLVRIGKRHGYQLHPSETAREAAYKIGDFVRHSAAREGGLGGSALTSEEFYSRLATLYDDVRYGRLEDSPEALSVTKEELEHLWHVLQRDRS